jgi:phage terminase large subunit-like protein
MRIIEQKQVHLPARAPWLETFRREILSFPASGNDDQVDALSQLLNGVIRTRQSALRLMTFGVHAATVTGARA